MTPRLADTDAYPAELRELAGTLTLEASRAQRRGLLPIADTLRATSSRLEEWAGILERERHDHEETHPCDPPTCSTAATSSPAASPSCRYAPAAGGTTTLVGGITT